MSRPPHRILVLACLFLCTAPGFLLSGCARPPAPGAAAAPPSGRVVVVTSLYPLADWARQVGGETVQVTCLLPPGASPHTFEPTPEAARLAARARLLLVVGLGLDDWSRRLTTAPDTETLALGEGIETLALPTETDLAGAGAHEHEHEHEAGAADPHVWMDPRRAAQMVERLSAALAELVPPGEREYVARRGQEYRAQLLALADRLEEGCGYPPGARIVTMHAGFNYLLAACGMAPARVISPFAGREPSARYLEALGRLARQERVRVVYGEPQLSPRAAEMLAREIDGRVLTLDALGDPGNPERDSYVELIEWDLAQLREGTRGP